jgi:two-component system, NarL family, sensor histidine kinase UhpB
VDVRLAKEADSRTMEVRDNGNGFSAEQLSSDSSLGVLGMREQALLLGGEFAISGAPGKGTIVKVQVPQPERKGK